MIMDYGCPISLPHSDECTILTLSLGGYDLLAENLSTDYLQQLNHEASAAFSVLNINGSCSHHAQGHSRSYAPGLP